MLGMSRTLKGDYTVFSEFMRVERQGEKLVYMARIGAKSGTPTPFALSKVSDGELVFENLAHDFPQRIIYRKADGGLFARIAQLPENQALRQRRSECHRIRTARLGHRPASFRQQFRAIVHARRMCSPLAKCGTQALAEFRLRWRIQPRAQLHSVVLRAQPNTPRAHHHDQQRAHPPIILSLR